MEHYYCPYIIIIIYSLSLTLSVELALTMQVVFYFLQCLHLLFAKHSDCNTVLSSHVPDCHKKHGYYCCQVQATEAKHQHNSLYLSVNTCAQYIQISQNHTEDTVRIVRKSNWVHDQDFSRHKYEQQHKKRVIEKRNHE